MRCLCEIKIEIDNILQFRLVSICVKPNLVTQEVAKNMSEENHCTGMPCHDALAAAEANVAKATVACDVMYEKLSNSELVTVLNWHYTSIGNRDTKNRPQITRTPQITAAFVSLDALVKAHETLDALVESTRNTCGKHTKHLIHMCECALNT